MDQVKSKLTVFFEDPFWVGIYEVTYRDKLMVSKMVYGAEPKDYEVYDYFLRNRSRLHFSPPVLQNDEFTKNINPKRMQRAINKQIAQRGIGTKAQQALKLQQEEKKLIRRSFDQQKKEEEQQRIYEIHQKKKKEKHKGR